MRRKEEWRPIPIWEKSYEVSSFGRVRSIDRVDSAGHRQSGKIRKLQISKRGGYYIINLRLHGKTFSKKVHHLVAFAYLGPPPGPFGPNGIVVDHLDGIKTNNHPLNLEYCTFSENISRATRLGLHNGSSRGIRNGRARLSENQVLEIRRLYKVGDTSIPKLARQFNIGKSSVGYIVQGATWRHLLQKDEKS